MDRSLTRYLPAAVLGLGLGLGLANRAGAAESEAIRIDYRAEASCPGADQFVADVLRRAPRARIASAGESARTFVIAISRTDSGFEGSLAVQGESSSTAARKVKGARCAEVAEVLALSTAIAVDPSAASEPRPPSSSGNANTGTAPSASTGSSSENTGSSSKSDPSSAGATPRDESKSSTKPTPAPEPEDREPVEREEPEPYDPGPSYDYASRRSGASILVGPELHTGVGPSLARGVVLGIEAASPNQGAWLSSLGIEFGYLALSTSRVGGAASSFELFVARPRLCGPALRASRLSLGACLSAELGLLTGSGSEIAFPESTSRLWAGAALPVRLQVDLSRTWLVEVTGGPVLAITRDEFVFQNPDTQIYQVPLLGFSGGLRVGARL
jgi:hypothetical protein